MELWNIKKEHILAFPEDWEGLDYQISVGKYALS